MVLSIRLHGLQAVLPASPQSRGWRWWPGEWRRFAYRTRDITVGLRFRRGFKFCQIPGRYPLDILTGGIMILVGGLGAHQLHFRLSFPVRGNGFAWAGRRTGQSACSAETGSYLWPLRGGIVGWFRLLWGLQAALISQGKFGLAVGPKVQLGPDPLVSVIKRQIGSPF